MTDTAVLDAPAADATAAASTDTASTTTAASTTAAASTTDATATTEPAKPAETAVAKVPETYRMQLPEGSTLDAAALERTAAIARELGLPDDASAQKVLTLVHEQVAAREAALLASHAPGGDAWTKQVAGWKTETEQDPKLGATPDERTQAIQRGHNVAQKYIAADPVEGAAFKSFLEDSGLGNHPAAARFFAWLGKAASELAVVAPSSSSHATVPVAQRLYPNMNP